jgi:hypothetical protein
MCSPECLDIQSMNFSSRTLTRLIGETQLEPCRVAADSHPALPAEDGHLSCPATTWRTASLGSSLEPLRRGGCYRSASMGIDRGCPWVTAADRWLGHVGGTAAR